MFEPRIIPCLLLDGRRLVKTVRFKSPTYIGDPRNAVKIFNELEVDELVLLDTSVGRRNNAIQYDLIEEIVSEAFMPVGYGGGIRSLEEARRVVNLGVEKIVVCTQAVLRPELIEELSAALGSQSVVVCIDVMRSFFGKYELMINGGRTKTGRSPIEFAIEMAERGAGEIIINSIDRDGTFSGYDIELMSLISKCSSIPLIASGGAGNIEDFVKAVRVGGASAAAAGSLFCFQGKHRAVLISYPSRQTIVSAFSL